MVKPSGGAGGDATVNGQGVARGGDGGRAGTHGYNGGKGGDATINGGGWGYARGGDGGDAYRPYRPALGARSPLAFMPSQSYPIEGMLDLYGVPVPGRGGDSYVAYVVFEGAKYCLNTLLHLLRGPVPKILDNGDKIIDDIDQKAAAGGVKNEQDWWNLLVKLYPSEAYLCIKHIRDCELRV
ncbi:MAG: hypothetical protein ACK4PK_02650 [Alphaproteobacteria bacterium]